MADEKTHAGPFDVGTVKELVQLMDKFDLSEVDLHDGEQRIRLRRGGRFVALPQPAFSPAAPPPAAAAAPPAAAAPARKLIEIKSEMVGTFYAKPKPDKDDYVKVGSRVTPDTVVCQIEAMKMFNEVKAGCSGTVAEVVAANGSAVEFDQVLFRVEPQ